MTRRHFIGFLLVIAAAIAAREVPGQTKQRVRFTGGADSTVVTGTGRGYAYRDYVVGASAGQSIQVRLASRGTVPVFTIFSPNGKNIEGAAQMNDLAGELPVSGDYVIRVGKMRAAARRPGSISNYSLTISIR